MFNVPFNKTNQKKMSFYFYGIRRIIGQRRKLCSSYIQAILF
jgi:hypothetical protein